MPNKWHEPDGSDWRPKYPERVPILGEYNDQETMDKDIAAAADHGVDAFSILYYYNDPGSEREQHSRKLNRGITNFMNSPLSERMKFFVEFCNVPPFEVETDEQWDDCINQWVEMMKHPSYLRVDGKLMFKVLGAKYFYEQSGESIEQSNQRLEKLRARVRSEGLGEMLIGGGVMNENEGDEDSFVPHIFKFTMTYMDMPPLVQAKEDYPYQLLADFAVKGRIGHGDEAIPHVPYVPAGWNPRPWLYPTRPFFAQPDSDQFVKALKQVKSDLDTYEHLGVPLGNGRRQKMFTIYAWNEFGEGGFIAPTKGAGYMKLKAIREVFGSGQ